MRVYPKSVHEGQVYPTRDGDLIVIKYNSALEVLVEFVDTGYRRLVSAGEIRRGRAKDRLKPSVYGVGYLGDGPHLANSRRVKSVAYIAWHNMIKRCYSSTYHIKYPEYADCTVASNWHNFQNFAVWFYDNHIVGFDLDKDLRVIGNRVYSSDTCQYINPKINRSTQASVNRGN